MPSLIELPLGALEEIVKRLESVEDLISLGSCSIYLSSIVGQVSIWRVFLSKTELAVEGRRPWPLPHCSVIREERLRSIVNFFSCLPNSDDLFSLLHHTIYRSYPARPGQARPGQA